MPVDAITFVIGPDGQVTVEGIPAEDLEELLGPSIEVNCGRPYIPMPDPPKPPPKPKPLPNPTQEGIRVHRIYHGSVVDGPGVRSVLQVQGCTIRCKGCYLADTWPVEAGVVLSAEEVITTLLDRQEVRDGVTIMGGEPMQQAEALIPVAWTLRRMGVDIVLYTGYTVERIRTHGSWAENTLLELADTVIDGPFVQALSRNAGEYRGSSNQKIRTREEILAA